jgi:hypothetical protein
LFRGYSREWNSGALQSSNEFSREWMNKKLLAVDQRVECVTMIDCFYKVADAFNKEETARVAITAIVLQLLNRRQCWSDFELLKLSPVLTLHPPF